MMGTCLFCDSRVSSRERIILRWMIEHIDTCGGGMVIILRHKGMTTEQPSLLLSIFICKKGQFQVQ